MTPQIGALHVSLGGHPSNKEIQFAVATMLREHGAPPHEVMQRADTIVQKLGKDQVQTAINSRRPWAVLKQLANDHSPPIKLIQPSELQEVIQARGRRGSFGGQARAKPPMTSQVNLVPTDLKVPPGVFIHEGGAAAHQIGLHQVKSVGAGIVVGSEQEITPYLANLPLTAEGLALLVVHPSQALLQRFGPLQRIPMQCVKTCEPILASVLIVQAGQKTSGQESSRNHPQNP